MQKKVMIKDNTLYTGCLLVTTIKALNNAVTERIQNNISVILILRLVFFYFISLPTAPFALAYSSGCVTGFGINRSSLL